MNDQTKQTMQMALEALEKAERQIAYHDIAPHECYKEAITALREALAQPQGQIKCACGDAYLADSFGAGFIAATGHCQNCDMTQPQGEWVDLTDDEVADLVSEKAMDMRMTYQGFIREVIAKFKEKNTPPVVPQGEPVAWMCFDSNGDALFCHPIADGAVPLYTTPPSVEAVVKALRWAVDNPEDNAYWVLQATEALKPFEKE